MTHIDDEVQSHLRALVVAGAHQVGPRSVWVQACAKTLREKPPLELRGCLHVSLAQEAGRRIPVLVHFLGSDGLAQLRCWHCFRPPAPTLCASCLQSPARAPGLQVVAGEVGDHIFVGAVCRACRAGWTR